jgi:hypothetical protein
VVRVEPTLLSALDLLGDGVAVRPPQLHPNIETALQLRTFKRTSAVVTLTLMGWVTALFYPVRNEICASPRRQNRPVLPIVLESRGFPNSENSPMKSKAQIFDRMFDGICVERK